MARRSIILVLALVPWLAEVGWPVDPEVAGLTPAEYRLKVVTPTPREKLDPSVPGTFQPTAAGNPESALFGSVRTTQIGKHLYPQFHEGVDIAPVQRNVKGMALDEVHAVADGVVAYINHQPANSNYGNYVVLVHDDPMGQFYTLYAHLAVIAHDLAPGQLVDMGTPLGIMGHTPERIIPENRAHLHFEVGVVGNSTFDAWFHAQRLTPDHGVFNGMNLFGINPLEFFGSRDREGRIEFRKVLAKVPVAFELMIPVEKPLDYFRRYPQLWQGEPFQGAWVVIACSEDGVILSGRMPTHAEMLTIASRRPLVLKADPTALGRNGCRLVVEEGGRWRIGEKGVHWLSILTY